MSLEITNLPTYLKKNPINHWVTYPLEKLGSRGTSHPNTGYFLVFPQEKKGEKKGEKEKKRRKKIREKEKKGS